MGERSTLVFLTGYGATKMFAIVVSALYWGIFGITMLVGGAVQVIKHRIGPPPSPTPIVSRVATPSATPSACLDWQTAIKLGVPLHPDANSPQKMAPYICQ